MVQGCTELILDTAMDKEFNILHVLMDKDFNDQIVNIVDNKIAEKRIEILFRPNLTLLVHFEEILLTDKLYKRPLKPLGHTHDARVLNPDFTLNMNQRTCFLHNWVYSWMRVNIISAKLIVRNFINISWGSFRSNSTWIADQRVWWVWNYNHADHPNDYGGGCLGCGAPF